MKKITLLIMALLLSFSFFSSNAFAADPLLGHWLNNKIKLTLKADKHYLYEVKILGVKKTFTGEWSSAGKKLTFKYTLLGKHQKTASYSFDKGDLLLTQKGKTSRLKKRK